MAKVTLSKVTKRYDKKSAPAVKPQSAPKPQTAPRPTDAASAKVMSNREHSNGVK